jgi:ParB/RepB/Spo0J family partition protein
MTTAAPALNRKRASKVENNSEKSPVQTSILGELLDLPIASIVEDQTNPRKEDPKDSSAIASLADSFRRQGQLQPIRVYRNHDGSFLLGYGHRRLQAARNVGWATIQAQVLPMPADRGEIVRARAIENLERANLTVFEEAVMVAQVIESIGGSWTEASIIEKAAQQLGRSPTWIRDRGYLAKLDPKVQKLVLDGRLPLGHARELAKLADKTLQKDGATIFAQHEDGSFGQPLARVQQWVRDQMRSLKVVPWDTGIPFANKPACSECPSNSANDHQLFEHDSEAMKDVLCLNESCFNHKMKACEAATKTAVKAAEKKKVEATAGAVLAVTPDYLKPARVVRELKRERGELPKAKPKATSGGQRPATAKEQIEDNWWRIENEWKHKTDAAIAEAVKAVPLRMVMLLLAEQTNLRHDLYNATQKTLNKHKAILDAVIMGNIPDMQGLLASIVKGVKSNDEMPLGILDTHCQILAEHIAAGWGVKLDPFPDKAAMIKAAEAKEGKPKKSAPVEDEGDEDDGAASPPAKPPREEKATPISAKGPLKASALGITAEDLEGAYSGDTIKAGTVRSVLYAYGEIPFCCIGTEMGLGGKPDVCLLHPLVPAAKWKGTLRDFAAGTGGYLGVAVKCNGRDYVMGNDTDQIRVVVEEP